MEPPLEPIHTILHIQVNSCVLNIVEPILIYGPFLICREETLGFQVSAKDIDMNIFEETPTLFPLLRC